MVTRSSVQLDLVLTLRFLLAPVKILNLQGEENSVTHIQVQRVLPTGQMGIIQWSQMHTMEVASFSKVRSLLYLSQVPRRNSSDWKDC